MSTLMITTQGAYLRKQGGKFVVTRKDVVLNSIPEAMLECVVLLGFVQVSTQAANELLEHGIPLIYLSRTGHFRGILQPGYPKNTERRLLQYARSSDPDFCVTMARAIVDAKIAASIHSIRKWIRNQWGTEPDVLSHLHMLRGQLMATDSLVGVRAVEAQAAKLHFTALARALPPGFTWQGRNRQPPTDPVNALLSFGYMMLLGYVVASIYAAGLDPYVGFLHQLEYGRPSFALDLLEPLRAPCADHYVLRILQADEMTGDDFRNTPDKGCRMSEPGMRCFVTRFQDLLNPENGGGFQQTLQAMIRLTQDAIAERNSPALGRAMKEAA